MKVTPVLGAKSADEWLHEGEVITVLALSGACNEEAKMLLWSENSMLQRYFSFRSS
jgi:hypothetical protein